MTQTILIVEDEPGLLEIMKLHLEHDGYRVVAETDGLKALHSFDEIKPDLVTLDLNIPTISGFRLIKLFKQAKTQHSIPIMIITAMDYEEAREVGQYGADDFMTKPFDPTDLVARVRRLLQG